MEHHPRSWIAVAALLAAGCAYGWSESEEDAADDGRVVDGPADDAGEAETAIEVCGDGCGDGPDDVCDAATGDACPCVSGAPRSCYSGPAGTSGVGTCQGSLPPSRA